MLIPAHKQINMLVIFQSKQTVLLDLYLTEQVKVGDHFLFGSIEIGQEIVQHFLLVIAPSRWQRWHSFLKHLLISTVCNIDAILMMMEQLLIRRRTAIAKVVERLRSLIILRSNNDILTLSRCLSCLTTKLLAAQFLTEVIRA